MRPPNFFYTAVVRQTERDPAKIEVIGSVPAGRTNLHGPSDGNQAYLPVSETGVSRFESEGGYQTRARWQMDALRKGYSLAPVFQQPICR